MNNEHYNNLENILKKLGNINDVLDAGSGRTSLNILTTIYNNSIIDAIVYPNDLRKINSIKENVLNNNYLLKEVDICKNSITKKYDLVLAHLLLGEALMFNNSVDNVLNSIFKIDSKYYIIYDYLEDNTIDYNYLEQYLINNNLKIINKQIFKKIEPQQFRDFLGENYICYLIKK